MKVLSNPGELKKKEPYEMLMGPYNHAQWSAFVRAASYTYQWADPEATIEIISNI